MSTAQRNGLLVYTFLSLVLSSTPSFAEDLFLHDSTPELMSQEKYQRAVRILESFPERATSQIDFWGLGYVDTSALKEKRLTTITVPGHPALQVESQESTGDEFWYLQLDQGNGNLAVNAGEVVGAFRLEAGSLELIPLGDDGTVLYLRSKAKQVPSELADYIDLKHLGWMGKRDSSRCKDACESTTTIQVALYFSAEAAEVAKGDSGTVKNWAAKQFKKVNCSLSASNTCVVLSWEIADVNQQIVTDINDGNLAKAAKYIANQGRKADLAVFLIVPDVSSYAGLAPVYPESSKAQAIVQVARGWFGLAHEIGHLLGGRHQDDSSDKPFYYGHGKIEGEKMTIMGSTLRIGAPTAYSHQYNTRFDNVCVFRQTSKFIAAYFP